MKKNYLVRSSILLLCLFLSHQITAQKLYNKTPEFLKGNSIWGMIEGMGLDFNSGTAVPIAMPNLRTGTQNGEGTSVVAHPRTGALLFYACGDTVYNANHDPMPNGYEIWGNYKAKSTVQGSVIVPFINDTNKFYLFSLDNVNHTTYLYAEMRIPKSNWFVDNNGDTVNGSLFYSVIDMSLNGGLGDVVPGMKNIVLDTDILSESMIAVPGPRGCGKVWLIVHTGANNLDGYQEPYYKAYEITGSGVNHTPVVSPGLFDAAIGSLAVSPDGTKIAFNSGGLSWLSDTISAGIEIGKFNQTTGAISDVTELHEMDFWGWGHGIVFSPNCQYVYYTIGSTLLPQYSNNIIQADVSDFSNITQENIVEVTFNVNNGTLTTTLPGFESMSNVFRLYNDTIYVTNPGGSNQAPHHLHRINNPNARGSACNLEPHAVQLINASVNFTDGDIGRDIVFMPHSDTSTVSIDTLVCEGWIDGIGLRPTMGNSTNHIWNNNSTDSTLIIDKEGIYWVGYYSGEGCAYYVDTFIVTGTDIEKPQITVDTLVLGVHLTYDTYQWMMNGQLISGATEVTYTVSINGDYQVIVTDENGCIDTSEIYKVTNAGVSIEDVSSMAPMIHVYPNPAQNYIHINSPVTVHAIISTLSGKVIKNIPDATLIPVSDLVHGMYLLRITDTQDRLLKVEKFIKPN